MGVVAPRAGLRRALAASAAVGSVVAAVALACGPGDIADLTAGRSDAGAVDAEPQVESGCAHASAPDRPTVDDGVSGPDLLFALDDIRFATSERDGGLPKPDGLDLDQTCTCPEPESCTPPDAAIKRPCDGDGGRDNTAGTLLAVAATAVPDLRLEMVREQIRSGSFDLLVSVKGWNGQPDDPNVIVGLLLSVGSEGAQSADAGRAAPLFDGTDVWTVRPSSVLGGADVVGSDCRELGGCVPAKADGLAYVRGGVLVAHLDLPLQLTTTTGTFTIDFLDATLAARLTRQGARTRIEGQVAGRWPVERLLAGIARIRNPQSGIALCASDAGLEVYQIVKQGVCESADLAAQRSFDRTAARCDALSNAFTFTAVEATAGTVFEGPTMQSNPCPDFKDRCQN